MTWEVYRHTNTVTNKSYIGITKYGIMKRWYQHITETFKYNSPFAFHNALRKHGKEVWVHEVLESGILTKEEAESKEIELIAKYNTYKGGYNCTTGGSSGYTKNNSDTSNRNSTYTLRRSRNSSTKRYSKKFWFYHEHLGTDYCTRREMREKYTLHKSSLDKVVAGTRNHTKGWRVIRSTTPERNKND